MHSYVQVQLLKDSHDTGEKLKKSKKIKTLTDKEHDKKPVFGETLKLPLDHISDVFEISLNDNDAIKDDLVGSIRVSGYQLMGDQGSAKIF